MTKLTDEPLQQSDENQLGTGDYTQGLIQFIKNTETPMTIGIQGEWGSGKTSLMHQIEAGLNKEVSLSGGSKFTHIKVNAWESSLGVTHEQALLRILKDLIQQLALIDHAQGQRSRREAWSKLLAALGLKALGALQGSEALADWAQTALGLESKPIKTLKKELATVVKNICETEGGIDRIVVYVDDLDRMKPSEAVSLLELLKNVFNLEHCVFVLAIDYNVVVKGLEAKFGEKRDKNDWEYRAFFDKLIQLPFQMPLRSYQLESYVEALFRSVQLSEFQVLDEDVVSYSSDIIGNLIGTNPRSIKRLVNYLSLLMYTNSTRIDDATVAAHLFLCRVTTVSLQLAHPNIFACLEREPNFLNWRGKGTDAADLISSGASEEWQEYLHQVCQRDTRDSSKESRIYYVLDLLRRTIGEEHLAKLMQMATGESEVTNLDLSKSDNTTEKGSGKWRQASNYEDWIRLRLEADHPSANNYPSDALRRVLETFYQVAREAFSASESENNDAGEYELRYRGGITLSYKKKKIMAVVPQPSRKSDPPGGRIFVQVLRSNDPKFQNRFLRIEALDRNFGFEGKPFSLEEDSKRIVGSIHKADFQRAFFYPESDAIDWTNLFARLIQFSSEALNSENTIRANLNTWVQIYEAGPSIEVSTEWENARDQLLLIADEDRLAALSLSDNPR